MPAGVEQFKTFMAERPVLLFPPAAESLPHLDLPTDPLPLFQGKIEDLLENLKYLSKQKYRISSPVSKLTGLRISCPTLKFPFAAYSA
jgi:hypothetical protein